MEEDEEVAIVERVMAQWRDEAVGWSSLADEEGLHAPPGTTDEQLMRYLDANYDPDALAKLRFIDLTNTQVTPKYRKGLWPNDIDAYRKDHGLAIPPQ